MIWNHCGIVKTRNPLDFIMWNHVFIAYESYRAYGVDSVLCVLGTICTILSLLRHHFRETCLNTSEPWVAKATQVYIALAASRFPADQILGLMCLKSIMLLLWLHEDRAFLGGYERAHPWLHILAALDAHHYIDCCARHSRIIPGSFT